MPPSRAPARSSTTAMATATWTSRPSTSSRTRSGFIETSKLSLGGAASHPPDPPLARVSESRSLAARCYGRWAYCVAPLGRRVCVGRESRRECSVACCQLLVGPLVAATQRMKLVQRSVAAPDGVRAPDGLGDVVLGAADRFERIGAEAEAGRDGRGKRTARAVCV